MNRFFGYACIAMGIMTPFIAMFNSDAAHFGVGMTILLGLGSVIAAIGSD